MTIALFAPLLVAALAGAALWLLWRRMESMRDEIGALRRQVEALENAGAMRRRANLHLAQNDEPPKRASAAKPPGARVLRFKRDTEPAARPALSDTRRGALLALAAAAPALGLFAGVDFALIGVIGVTVGALMMLLALSRSWSAAAWASVLTTAGWAIAALAVGGAQSAALLFSGALTCAAIAGLVQAFLARLAPGAALAAIAAAGALLAWAANSHDRASRRGAGGHHYAERDGGRAQSAPRSHSYWRLRRGADRAVCAQRARQRGDLVHPHYGLGGRAVFWRGCHPRA
ncbi:MAG: hypothetical protein NVV62_04300 [Terricaulis sp.]|nr:hypothetical protein [Terricaulis sp.]